MAISPPHFRHKITGRMVDEVSPFLLVVSHVLPVIPGYVTKSVEKPGGTVVMVVVGGCDSVSVDIDVVLPWENGDDVSEGSHGLPWGFDDDDSEGSHGTEGVLLATVAVELGEGGIDSQLVNEPEDTPLGSPAAELDEAGVEMVNDCEMTDEPGDELLGIGTIELDEAGVASIDEPDPIDGSDDTPLEDATVELSKEEASAVLDFAIVKSEVDGMTLKLVDDADVIVLEAVDSCGSLLLQSVDRVDSLTVLESTFAEICIEGDDLESVELDDARPAEGEEVLEWSLTEVDDASFNTTSVSLVLDCRDVDI
jgi:hypothetical protein